MRGTGSFHSGRLILRSPLHVWIPNELEGHGFVMLHVTATYRVGVASLPDHHSDPFDRLLIVQALHEGLTIVTWDAAFDDYAVPVLDAPL